MIITIADINGESEHDSFNDKLVSIVKQFILKNKLSGFKVKLVHNFEQLEELVLNSKDKHTIFSNFPPDSTYKEDTTYSTKSGVRTVIADSYNISKAYAKKLLEHDSTIHWHIITGAPDVRLSDIEITNLNPKSHVTVKRKGGWIQSSYYHENYREYVLNILSSSFLIE
jgi:hypothetical protein